MEWDGGWVGGWVGGLGTYSTLEESGFFFLSLYELEEGLEEGEFLLQSALHLFEAVGGWVGGWFGWVEGKKAVEMSCCMLGMSGVDGGGEGGLIELLDARDGWMGRGGWVGGWAVRFV